MKTLFGTAALALVPVLVAAQTTVVPHPDAQLPIKHAPQPTTSAITAEDLMTRLYLFADDSMQGREVGTIGNVKGTDYLAAEAKRIGLVPGGDNGTFFQTLPLMTRRVAPTSTLIAGSTPVAYGTEWVGLGRKSVSLRETGVVFGGVIDDSTRMAPADAVEGKLVVAQLGRTGFGGLERAAEAWPGAAGVVVIVPEQVLEYFSASSDYLDDGADRVVYLASGSGAAKLFAGRINDLPMGSAGKIVEMNFNVEVTPVRFPARNVIGIIPGSDPALSGQYVAIGAHNDHVGFNDQPVDHDSLRIFNHVVRPGGAEDGGKRPSMIQQAQVNAELAAWRTAHPGTSRPDSIFNGADDDGSGSVSVLEIAERLMADGVKPRRSILFVWHVGEEKGLWGAEYFTDHPTVPRDSIVAQLNIDMVGRGDAWDVTGQSKEGVPLRGGPGYLQLIGSRRLSSELGDLAETVNTRGKHGLRFDYAMDANGHSMNIYCRSDHYEYARYGIPVIFFTTGGHSDYHQVSDEPQYINYDHMASVDNFIADLLGTVGNLDHRVAVDQPKPDPKGTCQQ